MVSAAEYSSEQARGSGLNRYLRGVCSHKFQQRLGSRTNCFSARYANSLFQRIPENAKNKVIIAIVSSFSCSGLRMVNFYFTMFAFTKAGSLQGSR